MVTKKQKFALQHIQERLLELACDISEYYLTEEEDFDTVEEEVFVRLSKLAPDFKYLLED